MPTGSTVFSQLMDYLPLQAFHKCVAHYRGSYKVHSFSCLNQFYCMAFAQLTYRESLRDISSCLTARQNRLYHLGIRGRVSRSTLADANEHRDCRIYADFAQILIAEARALYAEEDLGVDLQHTAYALDATTIALCLSLFPWAPFRSHKAGVKLHTLLNLRGSIPSVLYITPARVHDVNILDDLMIEAGAIYIMDRAYVDFARLYALHQSPAFFVTRAKSNLQYQRLASHPVDRTTGLRSDQWIRLTGVNARDDYPDTLRRLSLWDQPNHKRLVFLTNNLVLPACTIAYLYQCRWRVELFFKWIKQHLRIKAFFGTSENAVHTQIWIAISVYVLVAIIKKRLALEASLYTILQILSVSLFEQVLLNQLFAKSTHRALAGNHSNQLKLLDL